MAKKPAGIRKVAKKKAVAKKVTRRKAIPKDMAPGGSTSDFKASFSLTFEVGADKKSFTVSMSDITGIITDGFDLLLPEKVELGSFTDFYGWIGEKFNITLPDLSGVPVVGQFMTGDVTIMKFHIKLPGTAKKDQMCDLAVNIHFESEITIIGSLALSDVDFGLTYSKA